MVADTSSAPAATMAMVGAAAAALAALIVEPTLARSFAAAASISGAAIRYDILDLHVSLGKGYRHRASKPGISA